MPQSVSSVFLVQSESQNKMSLLLFYKGHCPGDASMTCEQRCSVVQPCQYSQDCDQPRQRRVNFLELPMRRTRQLHTQCRHRNPRSSQRNLCARDSSPASQAPRRQRSSRTQKSPSRRKNNNPSQSPSQSQNQHQLPRHSPNPRSNRSSPRGASRTSTKTNLRQKAKPKTTKARMTRRAARRRAPARRSLAKKRKNPAKTKRLANSYGPSL